MSSYEPSPHPPTASDASSPPAVARVVAAVTAVPGVAGATLTGSRAGGEPTALSDWDFHLDVEPGFDTTSLGGHLGSVLGDDLALAVFWDPLSTRANLIVLVDGPVKVDLILSDEPNPSAVARWDPRPDRLGAVDAHFWDWVLWLGSKHLRGERRLVRDELDTMHAALLAPMGVPQPPADLAGAVAGYLEARRARETEWGVAVGDRLGAQVRGALAAHGLLADDHHGTGGALA